jgi:hypothetical protein
VFWTKQTPHGIEVCSKIVLEVPRRRLADMLVEVDDGASETDVCEAIQAAALADDWALADEIARRYGLVVCLRCASDMRYRPSWRLRHLLRSQYDVAADALVRIPGWGEVCGSCAVEILELRR